MIRADATGGLPRLLTGMVHVRSFKFASLALLPFLLAGCTREGDFDETGGIRVVRSSCPAVAIPAHLGDVTLFNPAESRDARAIDVVAAISNLRSTCVTEGEKVVTNLGFEVSARRADARGAREVALPWFAVVTRAGTQIRSKQVGSVVLRFEDGATRANARASVVSNIALAEAMLAPEIEERINRKRKAGDLDAATDPMSEPEVRAAVQKASFELLVGFQLSDAQLAYNATR